MLAPRQRVSCACILVLLPVRAVTWTPQQEPAQLLIYEGSSDDMGAMTAIGLLNRPATARPSAAQPFFAAAYASFGYENHHSREWLDEAVASDPQLRKVQITNTSDSTAVIIGRSGGV